MALPNLARLDLRHHEAATSADDDDPTDLSRKRQRIEPTTEACKYAFELPQAFREMVTQQEAHDAYHLPEAKVLGPTGLLDPRPTTGISKVTTLRGIKVVVKRIGDPDPRMNDWYAGPFEPERAYELFKREATNHLQAYVNLSLSCRAFLSIPACMDLDQTKLVDTYPYTVQTFLDLPGHQLMSAMQFFEQHTGLSSTSLLPANFTAATKRDILKSICVGFGKMVACTYQSGILHKDMHAYNVHVLVPHQWPQPGHTDVKWRVIDWGMSEPLNSTVPQEVCAGEDEKAHSPETNRALWIYGVKGVNAEGERTCRNVRGSVVTLMRQAMRNIIPEALIVGWVNETIKEALLTQNTLLG
tara:strand:- start:9 stop:1079 length:1071 start_codon:yes stop_codon:yes gene_type:complete